MDIGTGAGDYILTVSDVARNIEWAKAVTAPGLWKYEILLISKILNYIISLCC